MTAQILILPVVRVERDEDGRDVVVTLSRRDHARLKRRAVEWGLPLEEAASALLSQMLDPKGRR